MYLTAMHLPRRSFYCYTWADAITFYCPIVKAKIPFQNAPLDEVEDAKNITVPNSKFCE
ncbi:14770_t:CDS:2 [Cetraspora pellucida]|uniref:14770_t:CDS:1 n=1 Tax=Cetraspora pellucida TaxID=1433469 RepID=A0A9N9BW90_9GLOM|nr:14770_t:CDS:2 [Cetraspora pellucida]